ncbi:MAG: citryl-CoA lyase [Actinomycetia bacterium]|nr:citryl-CoA lyase [Actinomycetes bacterium]
MSPEFTTSISDVQAGRVLIRGYSHEELIGRLPYADAAFLTLVGRLPSPAEARLVDAILTSLLDHGFVAATVSAARYIASGNPEFVPAVAGGLLAAGRNTLSPEHSCGLIGRGLELQRANGWTAEETARALVEELRSQGQRIPGLGHPVHRGGDFRADVLFRLAEELGLAGEATGLYRAIHAEFVRVTDRKDIPINIDGCLACLGMDLGISAQQTVALALLAVLPGLMAHVSEEIEAGVPLRFIRDGGYGGEPYRPLPDREDGDGRP